MSIVVCGAALWIHRPIGSRGGRTGRRGPVPRAMRTLRRVGAVVVCVLATVVLIVAVVLCITIVLLPVGLTLGYAAIRMYKWGIHLALPRSADVKKGVEKQVRGMKKDFRKRLRRGKRRWLKR